MEGSRCEDGSVCFHGKCVPTDWLNCFTEDGVNKTCWFKGGCSDAKDPQINVIELGKIPNKWNCLDRCRSIPVTACEWQIASGLCYAYTEQIENTNGDSLSLCFIFKECTHIKFGFTIVTTRPPMSTWYVETMETCAEECKSALDCIVWSYKGISFKTNLPHTAYLTKPLK